MHHILRPVFADQLPDTADYDDQFDRTEALLGALGLHEKLHALEGTFSDEQVHAHWFGRGSWRSRYGRNPADELLAEAERQHDQWGPCVAGLFDGDSGKAIKALTRYADDFGRNLRW